MVYVRFCCVFFTVLCGWNIFVRSKCNEAKSSILGSCHSSNYRSSGNTWTGPVGCVCVCSSCCSSTGSSTHAWPTLANCTRCGRSWLDGPWLWCLSYSSSASASSSLYDRLLIETSWGWVWHSGTCSVHVCVCVCVLQSQWWGVVLDRVKNRCPACFGTIWIWTLIKTELWCGWGGLGRGVTGLTILVSWPDSIF